MAIVWTHILKIYAVIVAKVGFNIKYSSKNSAQLNLIYIFLNFNANKSVYLNKTEFDILPCKDMFYDCPRFSLNCDNLFINGKLVRNLCPKTCGSCSKNGW